MNIKELLTIGISKLKKSNVEEYTLKAKILLEYVLKKDRQYIITHENEAVSDNNIEIYYKAISKISAGFPIQYVTNKQEFMKMNFCVNQSVLIPQPDTEILVEKVIDIYNSKFKDKRVKVLDLCTGSGAIAISIAKYIPKSDVLGIDISNEALKIANKNSINNKIENVNFKYSDMFNNLNKMEFDIIVSNPPYIRTSVIDTLKEVKYEPHIALDGGRDGLDFYKIISKNAYKYLNNNGLIFLEVGYSQAKSVTDILCSEGQYIDIEHIKDLAGNDRVLIAKKKVK